MKEINDIIEAYQLALSSNQRMALATVVRVEGSSYRRPGARMLVTADGQLTGAISGGCLEGDALRKALLAIHQQQNKLVTYNTNNEDDATIGVQLGCNGIIHILFEYIDITDPDNPVALLERLRDSRKEAVVVTFFCLKNRGRQKGTVLLWHENQEAGDRPGTDLPAGLPDAIRFASEKKQTFLKEFVQDGSEQVALIEYLPPAIALVIAGAGNDAQPLVAAAAILGWETTVIDGRATHALQQRFPGARRVILAAPGQVADHIPVDAFTVFVLMTHNYRYDLAVLKFLAGTATPYIGILGPKTKLERMFSDLATEGVVLSGPQKERIYGPVGLDIGAETPEEIAVAIVSEIKAILSGRKGTPLKFLTTKIHNDIQFIQEKTGA